MTIECDNCGYAYNDDDADRCGMCNSDLHNRNNSAVNDNPRINQQQTIEMVELRPDSGITNFEPAPRRSSSPPDEPETVRQNDRRRYLEGRITHIERHDEKPAPNFFSVVSKILIGILIIVPYLAIFMVSAILSLSFAILGYPSISQLFNPIIWTTTIMELMEVIVLRRMKGTDTVPIFRGMVEDHNSQEYAFWFRGPIRSGNLVVGHNVRLRGRWGRGTFMTQNGNDLTSNSEILSSYRNLWPYIFIALVIIYILLGLHFYNEYPQVLRGLVG